MVKQIKKFYHGKIEIVVLFHVDEWKHTLLDILDYDQKHCLFYLTHQDENRVVQCMVKAIRRDFQYGFNFLQTLLEYGADPTQGNTWNALREELAQWKQEALRSKLGICQNILKKKIRGVEIMLEQTSKSFSRGLSLSQLYHYPERHHIISPDSIVSHVVYDINADMFQQLLSFF